MARKILLADDSVTAQNMGRKILADAGYEVITVNNGSAALKKIAEVKPDLIVLDVYMPGYSGLEVCQRLKETQESARTPVLLTVGKLEPFKPEEAKRVRADGFIVKPFEASELLSALTKLEDKIVPRAEASKPGRFARSIAAIEEGRYDRTMAVEEDSSWKNRIGFPSDKKKAAEKEDGDDPAIYNAVNKDLRTVVAHAPAPTMHEAPTADFRVDMGALAPAGLPKDVTPEEIAALAAAAAQVQSSIAASKTAEASPVEKATSPAPESPVPQEAAQKQETQEGVAPSGALSAEIKTEARSKAEETPKEKIDTPAHISTETTAEVASAIANLVATPVPSSEPISEPSPAHVAAAFASLEPSHEGAGDIGSGSGSRAHSVPDETADQPVTMAVAAGREDVGAASRWTAVAVAAAPEEAAISLENEMQKAYAAFAAAEGAHAGLAATSAEVPPVAVEETKISETSSPVEGAAVAAPLPELAHTLEEVASAATDAISAAVKELEAVAASYEEQARPHSEPAPAEAAEAPVYASVNSSIDAPVDCVPREPQPVEEAAKEIPQAELVAQEAAAAHASEAGPAAENRQNEEMAQSVPVIAAEAVHGNGAGDLEAPVHPAVAQGGSGVKESEIAATTAAAWASWRRIRESDDPQTSGAPAEPSHEKTEISSPQDAAAMAVAAGAEKSPEEAAAASDAEVASIVDSMLADLRPKIVEEISRKLGKKK